MDIKFDFNADDILREAKSEANKKLVELGKEAVAYAKENGNYKDRTGRLRRSNTFSVNNGVLTIENTAPYASNVESRGKYVLTNAMLYVKDKLI